MRAVLLFVLVSATPPIPTPEIPAYDASADDISFGKLAKRGVKFVRRYVRQLVSEVPEVHKGGVLQLVEDVVN